RCVYGRTNRQVDNADVVFSVMRQHPVEGGNNVADVAAPGAVEDLQRNEIRVGSDTSLLAIRVVAVAGDDAGDVGAVAVVVVGRGSPADEINECGNPLIAERILRQGARNEVVVPAD